MQQALGKLFSLLASLSFADPACAHPPYYDAQTSAAAHAVTLFQDTLRKGTHISVTCRREWGFNLRRVPARACAPGELPGAGYFDSRRIIRVEDAVSGARVGTAEGTCYRVVLAEGNEHMGYQIYLEVCTIVSGGTLAVQRAEFVRMFGLED